MKFPAGGAVRMLFWAAILNGALSPPVILLVVLLSSNPRVMGKRTNPAGLRWLGWTTFAVMSAASIGLFFTL